VRLSPVRRIGAPVSDRVGGTAGAQSTCVLPSQAPIVIAGRYGLVRRLAVGGMAEVWLARQGGVLGFEKLVVVKRILPHLSSDPSFMQMFLDEARTAADLRHSNVASITDVGTDDGQYFMAMEYLHGQDLTHIVQRCRARGEKIPIQHATQIISDAAQGLDYAHRKVDRHGAALQIVHRDVSPQNLLVTYEGSTKLLDFGIASAAHRTTHTDAGVVKGKFGYMSPEQFEGARLDSRSDLFSLGVVLWELVTLQRLFWRASDAETLKAVTECKVPLPSSIEPRCPIELEALIMNALVKDPAKRIGTCGDLAEGLDGLMERLRLPHSAPRVGAWLRTLFPEHSLDPTEAPALGADHDGATRNEKIRPLFVEARTHARAPRLTRPSLLAPMTLAKFQGRTTELAQLCSLFDGDAALVTLTGPAGQGKSRLAARFVELEGPKWKDNVWQVDLSDVSTPAALCRAVTFATGLEPTAISETAEQMMVELGERLGAQGPALLVLDNCDADLPSLAPWLAMAPTLCVLVTRATPLGIEGEHVLPLSGLTDGEGVCLLGTKAAEALGGEKSVALCQAVEGNPLALEVLGSRFEVLPNLEVTGQLSLRDAIAWSFRQLTTVERRALGRLSVCRGGFTEDAVEYLMELEKDRAEEVLEKLLLCALLGSTIADQQPGCIRFRMPEPVRVFAAAQLEADGLTEAARERHAEWYLRVAEEWSEDLSVERFSLLCVERFNLFAVFEHATPVVAVRALHALEPLLTRYGPYGLHLSLLTTAIAAATEAKAEPAELARAMQERANVQRTRGQSEQAMWGMTAALKMVRDARDRGLEGRILCDWSLARFVNADVDGSMGGLEKSLQIARDVGDGTLEVKALALKGMVHGARYELTEALACCDEALPLARARGDLVSAARVFGTVGSMFLEEGRTELARTYFDAAAAQCEKTDPGLAGFYVGKVAQTLAERGEISEARTRLNEALTRLRAAGDVRSEGLFLSVLASVEWRAGETTRACDLMRQAEDKLRVSKDPLLLCALSLRRHQLRLGEGEGAHVAAIDLLREVRRGKGDQKPKTHQSEEVRLAANGLDRALREMPASTRLLVS